jgi:quercetin dioxygenase-like cupin family protein
MKSAQPSPSKYLISMSKESAGIHRIGLHISVTGEQQQMTYIYMPPDAEVSWHSHPQESFVMVIQGGYEMWVGDEHFELKPGFACWVPADTPHRARVGSEPTVEIEVFSPPREDWASISPDYDFRKKDKPT